MNSMDMMSPEKVAEMYGGDKRRIGQAAQMGLVDPTVAVMAGMFIDRMRGAATQEAAPKTSVAEEVMAPAMAAPVAGLAAAQAAPPVESGLAALPVPEDVVPNEYAGGGVVAFAGEDGSLVESPFGRDIEAWKRAQRESMQERTPGMVGAWNRPLISPEQDERMRLLELINQQYGAKGSLIQGYFTGQSDAERAKAQDILKRAPTMSIEELRQITGRTAPTAPSTDTRPYTDEGKRGTAARIVAGGPGRTLEEFGVGATDMAALRTDEEAKKAAEKNTPAAAPAKEEPVEDTFARRKRMLREAGVSEDPYAADRAALEELKGKLGESRKFSDAAAMIRAGTQMLDKKSLGAGLKAAGETIPEALKERAATRSEERELAKIDRDLNRAEDALKRGDVDKALEYEDKAKQRDIQLRDVQSRERAAAKPSSIAELFAIQQKAKAGDPVAQEFLKNYLGAAKTGQVDERFLREQWGKMKPLDKMLLERQGIKTFEQWAASQGYSMGGAGGAGMGTDPLGLRGGR